MEVGFNIFSSTISSILNRLGGSAGPVGGLPRGPDRTELLSRVCWEQPKGRRAVFGHDGWPYRVRQVSSGQGRWTAGTAGDCGGRQGTVKDGQEG